MILLYLQYKDGQNKQSAATFVHISQDGGYIGIGWKGNISVFLKIHFCLLIILLNGSVPGSAGVFDFEIIRDCSNKCRYLEYQHT